MQLRVLALAAAAAHALTLLQTDAAAVTCPFNIQSRLASTLANPPIDTSIISSGSGSGAGESGNGDGSGTGTGSGAGTNTNVGDKDSSTDDDDSDDDGASAGVDKTPTTTPPSGTTAAPTGTTPKPSTSSAPSPGTPKPSTTPAAPSSTTPAPTPGDVNVSSILTGRRLQLGVNVNVNTTTGTVDAGVETPAPTTLLPSIDSTVSDLTGSNTTTTTGSGAGTNSTIAIVDSFTCDETFYKQWETNKITCGDTNIDVAQAVAASSCVIYSGTLGAINGTSCVSICAFPACNDGKWEYGASNGIASDVYKNVGIVNFLTPEVSASIASRIKGTAVLSGNTTMTSNQQCGYESEGSFSSCSCSALAINANKTESQIKKERAEDIVNGVISKDDTTNVGSVLGPTSSSVASVTVFMSGMAAIASSVVSSAGAASATAAVGANVAVVTVEICQFGVMINQMQLKGKSAALSIFGKKMAPSAFTFLPFGRLNDTKDAATTRRLSDDASVDRGVAQYSRTLGIREDMLFIVTLAGVVVVMAGILALFGAAYGIAGLFMNREDFLNKFFDKMIGLEVLVAILSQYTIGVTGTYQIYYSFQQDNPTDPKCILAFVAILGLALGIIVYGYFVVKRHEDDIKDVGTFTHINKKVCQRYGPIYEEYKFKNRYFFAAKMMLALLTGIATGYVGISGTMQVSIVLGVHVIFFFYLEMQRPHHSRFVQTATSFVTVMKIAVLALTFFLVNAAAATDMPSEVQNAISLAIVGLNLFVLVLLMIRSLYTFWKKYQMQRDAKYDEEESAAQEYFKDDTPQRKAGAPLKENPPYMGQNEYNNDGDDIRLRSGTHFKEGNGQYSDNYNPNGSNGAQHYIANPVQQDQYAMPVQNQYAVPVKDQYAMQPPQQQQQYNQQYEQQQYNQQYEQQHNPNQYQYPPQGQGHHVQQQQHVAYPGGQYNHPQEAPQQFAPHPNDQYHQRRNDVVEL
ncbi:hypothetical protein Poli38472_000522 [Pythium oligandrum]|uniref:TRP C-terminal domain-containing protein n=1 Tax=Pythium oligandrum TaxID=41045 RepID=A0A8K1FEF3_PYTOL|nr:hypothetical protein Poli38472_000522 [Pythium oligandrum]|eukprot:TMW60480.1 hypothetical protein Poli38472_000522 [Pythium oligandrum]